MVELGLPRILQPRLGLPGRMAGAGRDPARPAGSRFGPGICRRRAPGDIAIALAHWRRLAVVLLVSFLAPAEAQVLSSRIWPARDYTRLTLESRDEIKFTLFGIKDIERLVLDLKAEVKPQVFTLKPIAEYGHRLVLDLYPMVPLDPLAALIEESEKPKALDKSKASRMARLAIIVIDAGHGGEDPGATGRHGSREKNITLTIALRLKALVDAEPNMRALLTRDGDYYLPLHVRVDKARKVKADLFVSIHADAFIRPHARGSSVFALSERRATSEAASWLAKKENEADLVGGVNLDVKDVYLKKTLLDLAQTATIDHSLRLGDLVLRRLGAVNNLHKPRVEQASFAVLKAPDVPSILVETAFISNPQEEKRLNDESYQNKLARARLAGLRDYVVKHPPRPSSPLALN